MTAGRPSDYRSDYCEGIVEFCTAGYSLASYCHEIGVSRATLNNWAAAHPEFLEAVNRAKNARARWWEDQARKIAENGGAGGQATIVIFGLKNHAPNDYREKSELALAGGDKPIQVETSHAAAVAAIEEAFESIEETSRPSRS
jgi:transposase